MANIHLCALGCRLNEAELENWALKFQNQGHQITAEAEQADMIVLNSCAVTGEAARKSRQSIKRLHRMNPAAKLVISGCYASLEEADARAQLGVDLLVHNQHKDQLPEITGQQLCLNSMPQKATEPASSALFTRSRQRAFIKVQDGCRYRCTFCVVTLARGEERSRPLAELVTEVNQYVLAGVQEIVLTGVHVGGYGSDNQSSLAELVRCLLKETDVQRIRFASVEPWELEQDLLSAFSNPRLMPHMHLPLQSGSDRILRRMARRCRRDDFRQLLANIRQQVPGFSVTTDIIVGFPGETQQDWEQTMSFCEEMAFSHIHVFSYSPRQGTKAAGLPDHLPASVKKSRSQALHKLAGQLKLQALQQHSSRQHKVLWESPRQLPDSSQKLYSGYTENYLRASVKVDAQMELENTITTFTPQSVDQTRYLLSGITGE